MKTTAKILLPVSLILFSISANAQTETVSNHSVALTTIGARYSYEQPLGEKFTVMAQAGLICPFMGWGQIWNGFAYTLSPAIGIEPRFYYNLAKREAKGKNIHKNSGNYLATEVMYIFKPIARKNVTTSSGVLIAPNWGLRRVYHGRWLLEFSTGINCVVNPGSDVSFGLRTNLKFGFVF